jgi:hypothetical protein
LPKSQTVAEVQIAAKILLNLGFWQQFRILATVWNFGKSLGFRQQFGILAIVWDLEFRQLTYAKGVWVSAYSRKVSAPKSRYGVIFYFLNWTFNFRNIPIFF